MDVIKSYRRGSVTITKFRVPWEDADPATCTELIVDPYRWFQEMERAPEGFYYLNPGYLVTVPPDSPLDLFVKHARRAQVLWNKQAARVMGRGRRRSMIKAEEPQARQLLFTGIMVLNGRPIHPRAWPDSPAWKVG